MLKSLLNLTKDVVTTPISVAQDAVTLGGTLNDKDESYTEKKTDKIVDDVDDVIDSIDDFIGDLFD